MASFPSKPASTQPQNADTLTIILAEIEAKLRAYCSAFYLDPPYAETRAVLLHAFYPGHYPLYSLFIPNGFRYDMLRDVSVHCRIINVMFNPAYFLFLIF